MALGYLMAGTADSCEGLRGIETLRGTGMLKGQYAARYLLRLSLRGCLWVLSHSSGCGYVYVERSDVVSGPLVLFFVHFYNVTIKG